MTQFLCDTCFVEKKALKKNFNLNVLAPVAEAFEEMLKSSELNGKQPWVAATAAMLMLLQADAETRAAYFRRIVGAMVSGEAAINELLTNWDSDGAEFIDQILRSSASRGINLIDVLKDHEKTEAANARFAIAPSNKHLRPAAKTQRKLK